MHTGTAISTSHTLYTILKCTPVTRLKNLYQNIRTSAPMITRVSNSLLKLLFFLLNNLMISRFLTTFNKQKGVNETDRRAYQ